jgi:hypothetical protein
MIYPKCYSLTLVFCSITAYGQSRQPQNPSASEPTLAYADVQKDVTKYVGKSVIWEGESYGHRIVIGPTGIAQSMQLFRLTPPGDDESLVFAVDLGVAKRTDACKILDNTPYAFKRRVSGRISKDLVEITVGVGATRRTTKVPLLSDALIDAPAAEIRKASIADPAQLRIDTVAGGTVQCG